MRLLLGAGVCLLSLVSISSLDVQRVVAAEETVTPNVQFEKMKTLVGDWEHKWPDGFRLRNTFRIFGNGSALLHLEKPDNREEVITIFYPVGAELRGDHYCHMRNQPRYIAGPSSDPNVITFEFHDITNLAASPEGRHMHSTTWRFIDADHLTQEWHVYANGKEVRVNVLEFTRVK